MATLIVVEDLAAPSVVGWGGIALHVLHYLEGLRRLGHDVYFVEFLEEPPEPEAVRYFEEIVDKWWSRDRAALLVESTLECAAGLDAGAVAAIAGRADALITASAQYRREPYPLVGGIRPRILIDSDPAYTQLWAADQDDPAEIFGEHDVYFTIGTKIGTPGCQVPTLGFDWHPTVPPVVLDWWPPDGPRVRDRFTTIGTWRDSCGYIEFGGEIWGPKVEEFLKFIDLPRLAGEPLELALAIDPEDEDLDLLRDRGWVLEDPAVVASATRFIDYIAGSAGEFTCANGAYVGTRCGWFPQRSACYLAAGRPVVLQATGFEDVLPTGEGLFAVSSAEQAAAAIREIRADYARHSAAARVIAREHLDAAAVLRELLDRAGIAAAEPPPSGS
jgi:hypothetical protein